MTKKSPITTNSRIRSALRQLWMRSRERAEALKAAKYSCCKCGKKQSRAKGREVYVEVHHKRGVDWDGLFDDVRGRLIHPPEDYDVLCYECHQIEHKKEPKK